MITLIHRSYKMGLFTATHGTYSVRLSDGSFLITPFGFDRAYLEEDDLVRVKGGMKEKLPIDASWIKLLSNGEFAQKLISTSPFA